MSTVSNNSDLRDTHSKPWTHGYATGYRRGTDDANAETGGWYTRNRDHTGNDGEPPGHPAGADLDTWNDGFLTGYAHGRRDHLGGAA